MNKKHHVILSPGMDGRMGSLKLLTSNWPSKHGLFPEVVQTIWKNNEVLKPKLTKILDLIEIFVDQGEIVSLIGTSASGSLMLNAFVERKNVVHKVVNISGFVRPGNGTGAHSFEVRSAASGAFRKSVLRFQKLEPSLTNQDRKKILTVRSMFGDELVPADTVTIQGATNKTVPMIEHVLSIAAALVLYDPVIKFLKSK